MSDIPMARTALEVIAIDLEHSGQPHIARAVRGVIADYLYREPPIRRAPTNSNKVTPRHSQAGRDHGGSTPVYAHAGNRHAVRHKHWARI